MNIKSYDFYYDLRSLPFVQGLYLFGSRAQGTESERSDIDLAILCPNATENEWRKICSIIESAKTLLGIDCVRLDSLKDESLKHAIEKNKIVLFEKKENDYSWYDIFLDLGEAIEKLENVLRLKDESFPYVREASIQIFEYSFELFWKWLKKLCFEERIEVNSPKMTLQKAYSLKFIDDENVWLDMMEDRNLTLQTYKQPNGSEIVDHLSLYVKVMRKTYDRLKKQFNL
ncbi:MAG: hypothetical protein B7Y25_06445 [Alphaproteobacteria bacterium 16-39-46]|nr:MAG: hypothetical protein B7Y25_06445 [Alphaproteobacteria bacterium 16-39-46]OZA42276.1 MAG: hypothetical protein B7X84_06515 [Alphaproteobacteria bacterium 17-39-52]HQS84055.1 HI0074 family nucleotidyltransferase substrate-binding subunit [Alphaproteobacteria bacterium]HQS93917.1 HI0074 family nucleotidyltransferase substrate-binding subunit [Alphaproteobacteria bacterium]